MENLAFQKEVQAMAHSIGYHPKKAVDGVEDNGLFLNGASCSYLDYGVDVYFLIVLGGTFSVAEVRIRQYQEKSEYILFFFSVSKCKQIQCWRVSLSQCFTGS